MVKKAKKTILKKTHPATKQIKPESASSSYLRFGESYTSLILGIIVVIIAIVLALGFLRNRTLNQLKDLNTQNLNNQTQPGFESSLQGPEATVQNVNKNENVYIVKSGDNLWKIAQKAYNSGYNWIDIAKANKLLNADVLNTGDKLIIPNVPKRSESSEDIYGNDFSQQTSSISTMREVKVTSNTYTVEIGDSLWDIALRAYGDGYRWVNIAELNNLPNPDIINEGTSLKLPKK